MTSEIRRCHAQVGKNQITEGFYTIEGETLTMVYADGRPVIVDGQRVTANTKGMDARSLAVVLTKGIRSKLTGERVPGFNRALDYENGGIA